MRGLSALMLLVTGTMAVNPNDFEATFPGGDTMCIDGGAYQFMHRKGTVKKLVIEMEGGGACWNDLTCNPIKKMCTQSIAKNYVNGINSDQGIHNKTNPENPFADWYHVFVPYCSCDVHTGNNDLHYLSLGKKHHRGHANFMSALNWTLANFPKDMEAVTVTGSSAGSAGTFFNWPFVAKSYPTAKHYVFGDSYIGVFSESQWNKCWQNWKVQFPLFIPGITLSKVSSWYDGVSCYMQEKYTQWAPNAEVTFYTSNSDIVQTTFYTLGGGNPFAWTETMRGIVDCYHKNTSIHTYIAPGNHHTSEGSNFFTVISDGRPEWKWLSDIVTGRVTNITNVDCADDDECKASLLADQLGTVTTLNLTGYANRYPGH